MKTIAIEDLPHASRLDKLIKITPGVEVMLEMDLPIGGRIFYGTPLYRSFGLTKRAALQHGKSEMLLMRGCELKVSPIFPA